jgi:hypothetical protein
MTNLTQFFPKSSESPVGEIRVVVGGIYNAQPVITAPDGSVWLREDGLYPIADYPEAAKRCYGAGGEFVFSPFDNVMSSEPLVCASGNNKVFFGGTWQDSARSTSSGINFLEYLYINGNGGNLISAAFGSGRFIIGGDSNSSQVATSTDLVTWSNASLFGGIASITAVAAGGGFFVAATSNQLSSGQNFARSTNGTTWSTVTGTMFNGPLKIAYGQGKFVGFNQYGRVETSTDGLTWSGPQVLNGNSGDRYCNQFAYANGTYVGVGYNNIAPQGLILSSTDGEIWVNRSASANLNIRLDTVTYGAGVWVAGSISGGWIAKSTDAVTWTTQTVGASFQITSIAYTDKFIAVGASGNIRTSTDGTTWTARTSGVGVFINALAHRPSDNRIVGVGSSGAIIYSTDGITWTNATSNNPYPSQDLNSIAYGNGVWVATGGRTRVVKSTDAVTWTVCAPITDATQSPNSIPYIAFNSGNNLFGAHFIDSPGGIQIYTSTNGESWITRTDESGINFPSSGQGRLFGWSAVNGKFIGISDWGFSGGIYQTADGLVWNHLPYSTNGTQYKNIAYGNGLWVVVGAYGNIYTSTDARSWVNRPSPQSANFLNMDIKSVAYNENSGVFVYAGQRTLGMSTDGITWEPLAQNEGNLNSGGGYSVYNWVCSGLGKSFYIAGNRYPTASVIRMVGYTPDPTVAYAEYFDASQYFYVPAISQGTYTVGTSSTGTQVSGNFLTTNNTEGVAYMKGK